MYYITLNIFLTDCDCDEHETMSSSLWQKSVYHTARH